MRDWLTFDKRTLVFGLGIPVLTFGFVIGWEFGLPAPLVAFVTGTWDFIRWDFAGHLSGFVTLPVQSLHEPGMQGLVGNPLIGVALMAVAYLHVRRRVLGRCVAGGEGSGAA